MSKLWVPGTDDPKPGFYCRVCKRAYSQDEYTAFKRHVEKCANRNEDVLHRLSPKTRLGWLAEEVDPEYGAYHRRKRT